MQLCIKTAVKNTQLPAEPLRVIVKTGLSIGLDRTLDWTGHWTGLDWTGHWTGLWIVLNFAVSPPLANGTSSGLIIIIVKLTGLTS